MYINECKITIYRYFCVAMTISNLGADGLHLLELNRVLRPGGYFVWSATPVYQKLPEDVEIWKGNSIIDTKISLFIGSFRL